jgi:molybdate transport system substrate-binding protein
MRRRLLLERLGIAEAVAARRQPFPRGLAAAQAVAEGRAALVMTQTSEIVVVPGVTLFGPLPESLQPVTPCVAAVPLRAALAAEAGKARFRAAGFAVG